MLVYGNGLYDTMVYMVENEQYEITGFDDYINQNELKIMVSYDAIFL